MIVLNPNQNPSTTTDSALYMDEAKQFLNNLTPYTEASNIEMQIKNQQDVIDKAEKKLNSLVNDANDLNKRKLNIEQKISDNQKDQEKQRIEIDKQRQTLSSLMSQRKS